MYALKKRVNKAGGKNVYKKRKKKREAGAEVIKLHFKIKQKKDEKKPIIMTDWKLGHKSNGANVCTVMV